ncbi:MAG: diacylglycerol kinase [Bacilli bacterium]|nr:diacylglycerol kinase [Bacilli bacterium]
MRFLRTFKFSYEGLKYAYANEQSMLTHLILTIITVIIGFIFHITLYEWLIISICLTVILAFELINTAIEAAVDLVTLEIHPLAKIAKDCGSAATGVSSIMAAIIIFIIFLPYILALF